MKKVIGAILTIVLFIIIYKVLNRVINHEAKNQMQEIENQVALDAEKQYEIAKRQGDVMQTYLQAGLVAASYLQAKDEVNYRKWKAIEKEASIAAGMPQ